MNLYSFVSEDEVLISSLGILDFLRGVTLFHFVLSLFVTDTGSIGKLSITKPFLGVSIYVRPRGCFSKDLLDPGTNVVSRQILVVEREQFPSLAIQSGNSASTRL